MSEIFVIRNPVTVIRCNATGGTVVPIHTCTGHESVKRCPYFGGLTDQEQVKCSYKPGTPKKYVDKGGSIDDARTGGVRYWSPTDPILPTQITNPELLGYEWKQVKNVTREPG